MSALANSAFNYAALDKEARSEVELSTARIHQLERRTSEALIEIGRHLMAVKEKLEHGRFTEWLTCEFGWTYETARRFMRVAAVFGENTQIVCFAPSALYALASGAVPDDIREEFIERAESGEAISHKQVQAALRERKGTAAIIAPTSEPIEVQLNPELWTCVECGQEWPESRRYCPCMVQAKPPSADPPTDALPEHLQTPAVDIVSEQLSTAAPAPMQLVRSRTNESVGAVPISVEIVSDADVFIVDELSPEESAENTEAFLTSIVEDNVPYVLADLLGKPILPINRTLREFQNIPISTLHLAAAKNPDFLEAAAQTRDAAQRLINLCAAIQGQSEASQIRRVV